MFDCCRVIKHAVWLGGRCGVVALRCLPDVRPEGVAGGAKICPVGLPVTPALCSASHVNFPLLASLGPESEVSLEEN